MEYENVISKLKEELNGQHLILNAKIKELENIEMESYASRKDYESKIVSVEELYSDSQSEVNRTNERFNHIQEDLKRNITTLTQELEEHKQLLEEKEVWVSFYPL